MSRRGIRLGHVQLPNREAPGHKLASSSISPRAAVVAMPVVQFAPFSSLVQPAFWHAVTELKIDVLRLSDEAVNLTASYSTGRAVRDRETGREIALGCHLTVGGEAFLKDQQ